MPHLDFRAGRHRCGSADTGLCRSCRDRLENHLVALPAIYDELEASLVPAPPGVGRGPGPAPDLAATADAVEARAAIRGTLAAWAELVVDSLAATPPRRTVPALAAFLRRHADWLADHCAARDAAAEMDELVCGSVRAASRTRTLRHLT
ncbi:hypothetical protein [Streptomyces sp. URMC 123]|uniref:hypothetical protein n=1 Tax=Streptomyces sp. URMC 123 TaxID=3423403 RepID=UPI003F1DC35E